MKALFALLVMLAVPLFIPVLPVPGLPGLLAGLLGGYLAGRPGLAVQLALLPSALIAVLIALVGLGVGLPLVGGLVAGIALLWLAIENVALILGAWIGGILAVRSERARAREAALSEPAPSQLRVATPEDATRYAARDGRPAHDAPRDVTRAEAI